MSQRALKRRPAAVEASASAEPRATRSDDLRRDFLRLVSHELRTPLNSIIGFSEILGRELYGPLGAPQYREYAEIIQSSGIRLLRLVNQVLELAKLDAGGGELEVTAESLEAVFEDSHKAVAAELAARRLVLDVELDNPAPSALADARAIRTALVNLLQNAATWAPEGSAVRLTGRARGPLVHIEVADDGPGLDPQKVEALMRPFDHAQGALTHHDGAGFGWVIVQALCHAMGARFEVFTASGEGLRAVLSFRRAR